MNEGVVIRTVVLENAGGGGQRLSDQLGRIAAARFETISVPSAREAVEALGDRRIGLIALDRPLSDPAMVDDLRTLGDSRVERPIIVVSDQIGEPLRATALRAGAEEVFARDEIESRLFALDVERIVAGWRLNQNRQQLDALLDYAPSFILAVDRQGIIQFINRTLPGFDRNKVVGSCWLDYIVKEQRSEVTGKLDAVLRTASPQVYETKIIDAEGRTIWFSSSIAPVRHGDQIVGAVIVAQDSTETRRTQADLLAAQRLASVGTLAAGIAHEINSPVQFVSDSIDFLRSAVSDLFTFLGKLQELRVAVVAGGPTKAIEADWAAAEDESDVPYIRENVPAAFDRCVDGLRRVATIVRSLKEFAHPSGNEMAAVDLNRAIQSTLTIARNEYKYVADLEVEFGDLPLVTCHGDEINQVVLNILVNAAHAIEDVVRGTDSRGRITIRTSREDDNVLIAIGDTGGGIPPEILSRIFDPFFTTKEVGKGTGQGLAIARTIVHENHRGDITVDTAVGEGTTFSIRLPIAPSVPAPAAESARDTSPET